MYVCLVVHQITYVDLYLILLFLTYLLMYVHMYVGDISVTSTLSISASESSGLFKYPVTITDAYSTLISELTNILKDCDLSRLKATLLHQTRTPDGVKLNRRLRVKIESAKSSFDLLYLMHNIPSCNWLDTRLIGALAHGCGSKSAVNLLQGYKSYVFSKKLSDALPSFVIQPQTSAYVTAVSMKIRKDPDKITISDILQYLSSVKNVILDLGNQRLNIKHVKKGCLEVFCHIPIHCRLNAYKMALLNRHKFYTVNLMHIEIGDLPPIFDPWFSDVRKDSVKQSSFIQCKGTYVRK